MSAPEHQDPTPRESIALSYDPGKAPSPHRMVTGPLRPFEPENKPRSPIIIILAAMVLLGAIVGAVFFAAIDEEATADSPRLPMSAPLCVVTAMQEISVRVEPDYAAPRAWIMNAGDTMQAVEQYQGGWLRLLNGWIARDAVTLSPEISCDSLPVTRTPLNFNDDLDVPDGMNWPVLIEDSFATDTGGWLDSIGDSTLAALREGYLVLFSPAETNGPQARPVALSDERLNLQDAYFAAQILWIASDLEAEVSITFRETDAGAYRVAARRDGALLLTFVPNSPTASPIALADFVKISALTADEFILGVRVEGESLTVYINGDDILHAQDDRLSDAGTFSMGLVGRQSTVYIRRFEVLAPAAD